LLLSGLAYLADTRPLLSGYGQELLPGFLAIRARLVAKRLSDLRMHRTISLSITSLASFSRKKSVG